MPNVRGSMQPRYIFVRLMCSPSGRSNSSSSICRSRNDWGQMSLRNNLSCDPLERHGEPCSNWMEGSQHPSS